MSENLNVSKSRRFNRLRVILASKEITQIYLSKELGVTPVTVSRWVKNKAQPNLERLNDISRVLGVSVSELLES